MVLNYFLVKLAVKDRNSDDILKSLERILNTDPSNANIMKELKSRISLDKLISDEPVDDGTIEALNDYFKCDERSKLRQASNKAVDLNKAAEVASKNEDFDLAARLYSEALHFEPKNVKFLLSRSDCYKKSEKLHQALNDALRAIGIDRTYWKSYARAIDLCLLLGDVDQAEKCSEQFRAIIVGIDPETFPILAKLDELKSMKSKVEEFYNQKNFEDCLKFLVKTKKISPHCEKDDSLQVECLIKLEKFTEAREILTTSLNKNSNNVSMLFNQGLMEYFTGDLDRSLVIFEIVLNRNREFPQAEAFRKLAEQMLELKQEGEDELMQSNFDGAKEKFTQAAAADPTNKAFRSKMYRKRGCAAYKQGLYQDALADYNLSLRLNPNCVGALAERAKLHFTLQDFGDCIIDCDEILKLKASTEIQKLLKDAKLKLVYLIKRHPHEILGILEDASRQEIDEASERLLTAQHNPNNHPDATRIEKKKLTRRLKLIEKSRERLVQQLDQRNNNFMDMSSSYQLDNNSETEFLIAGQRRGFFGTICWILSYLFCCWWCCVRSTER